MDEAYRARAERRRQSWQGGVARSFGELDRAGLEFWQSAPGGARLQATWQMIIDAWIIGGKREPPPRFDGSTWGVLRFER